MSRAMLKELHAFPPVTMNRLNALLMTHGYTLTKMASDDPLVTIDRDGDDHYTASVTLNMTVSSESVWLPDEFSKTAKARRMGMSIGAQVSRSLTDAIERLLSDD